MQKAPSFSSITRFYATLPAKPPSCWCQFSRGTHICDSFITICDLPVKIPCRMLIGSLKCTDYSYWSSITDRQIKHSQHFWVMFFFFLFQTGFVSNFQMFKKPMWVEHLRCALDKQNYFYWSITVKRIWLGLQEDFAVAEHGEGNIARKKTPNIMCGGYTHKECHQRRTLTRHSSAYHQNYYLFNNSCYNKGDPYISLWGSIKAYSL